MLVSIALNPTILFLDIYLINYQESVDRTCTKFYAAPVFKTGRDQKSQYAWKTEHYAAIKIQRVLKIILK